MKDEKELRKKLAEITKEIRSRKLAWRFNYSVGLPSGSCFGSSWEDETLLVKNHSPQTPLTHSHREKIKGRRIPEKVVASRIRESRLPDADTLLLKEKGK